MLSKLVGFACGLCFCKLDDCLRQKKWPVVFPPVFSFEGVNAIFKPMKVLYVLISLINSIFIKCLFISVLSIIIAGKVLKTDSRNAFAIIKWIILIYAALNICYYIFVYLYPTEMGGFWDDATGPYSFAFYFMLLPNTILPLLLCFKKLGRNKYVLLVLSLLMNISWMIEVLVMYRTITYRDHIVDQSQFNYLWLIVLNGVFVGAVIYAIGRALTRKMPDIKQAS